MNKPINDDLSPPEQIAADFDNGNLTFETATVHLLMEICMGIWAIAHDMDRLASITESNGETKH